MLLQLRADVTEANRKSNWFGLGTTAVASANELWIMSCVLRGIMPLKVALAAANVAPAAAALAVVNVRACACRSHVLLRSRVCVAGWHALALHDVPPSDCEC